LSSTHLLLHCQNGNRKKKNRAMKRQIESRFHTHPFNYMASFGDYTPSVSRPQATPTLSSSIVRRHERRNVSQLGPSCHIQCQLPGATDCLATNCRRADRILLSDSMLATLEKGQSTWHDSNYNRNFQQPIQRDGIKWSLVCPFFT
jgi:hypothetical protein